jgi:histone H3/H4
MSVNTEKLIRDVILTRVQYVGNGERLDANSNGLLNIWITSALHEILRIANLTTAHAGKRTFALEHIQLAYTIVFNSKTVRRLTSRSSKAVDRFLRTPTKKGLSASGRCGLTVSLAKLRAMVKPMCVVSRVSTRAIICIAAVLEELVDIISLQYFQQDSKSRDIKLLNSILVTLTPHTLPTGMDVTYDDDSEITHSRFTGTYLSMGASRHTVNARLGLL